MTWLFILMQYCVDCQFKFICKWITVGGVTGLSGEFVAYRGGASLGGEIPVVIVSPV